MMWVNSVAYEREAPQKGSCDRDQKECFQCKIDLLFVVSPSFFLHSPFQWVVWAALELAWLAMAWRLRNSTVGRLRLVMATW